MVGLHPLKVAMNVRIVLPQPSLQNMSNVIWVDENDNVLGEITREKAHKEGLLHRIAAVYLVNDNGENVLRQ